jgi:hypothetical protein
VTTRRIGAAGSLLLLAGLALGLVLAGPWGRARPARPTRREPVRTTWSRPVGDRPGGSGGSGGNGPRRCRRRRGTAGHDPAAGSDGTGGAAAGDAEADDAPDDAEVGDAPDDAEVGDAATAENDDPDEADADEPGDEESAAGEEVSERAAPDGGGRGVGPILIVVGTAVLLGGAVVAIARRI